MKSLPYLAAALVLAVPLAHAQERTAGSPLETQMTWTTLVSRIEKVSAKADAANIRVDQGIMCGKKGMFYAPGAPGSDGQGCQPVATDPNIKNVKKLGVDISTMDTTLKKVQGCGRQGLFYAPGASGADNNGCMAPKPEGKGKSCNFNQTGRCGKEGCSIQYFNRSANKWERSPVPANWKDGDIYVYKLDYSENNYAGGQCRDGVISYWYTAD